MSVPGQGPLSPVSRVQGVVNNPVIPFPLWGQPSAMSHIFGSLLDNSDQQLKRRLVMEAFHLYERRTTSSAITYILLLLWLTIKFTFYMMLQH